MSACDGIMVGIGAGGGMEDTVVQLDGKAAE